MSLKDKKVVIIDYDLGNLFSVIQACKEAGLEPIVTSEKKAFEDADALILPGVGAFGEAMDNLNSLGLVEPIRDFVASGKPLLGVCLGMQLLFSGSEEFGNHEGLGIIDGQIKRFPNNINGEKVAVPQIAWNEIHPNTENGWMGTPCEGLPEGSYMYFIHSFYAEPSNPDNICSYTDYEGLKYCSSVKKDNVFATQFHPEKSAHKGMEIYQNWVNMYLGK